MYKEAIHNMHINGKAAALFTIFFVVVNPLKEDIFESEHRLQNALMTNYSSTVRPATELDKPVHVQLMLDLMRIDELDATKETMTTTFMLTQTWKDPRLAWNTSHYGGVKSIRLKESSIWRPDIEVANQAPGLSLTSEALPFISYDGTVVYVPYKTVPTYCAMDLTLFPFDTQKCIIKLTPWTHNALEIDLGLFGHYLNTTDQMKIPRESLSDLQWELLDGTATLSSKKFDCCPEKYSFFEVSLQMSRKTNFYRYVVTWPSVVACFLVPFLFAIPSHSSQKITYGLALMIFESIIILTFAETNSFDHKTVPNIAIFHLITLILTSTSLLLSIFIVSISCGDMRKHVPAWLQRLALTDSCLRRVLCLGQYRDSKGYSSGRGGGFLLEETHETHHHEPELRTISENEVTRDVSESLRAIAEKMSSDECRIKVTQDWREVGRLLDRVLFFLCILTVLVLLIWSARLWSG